MTENKRYRKSITLQGEDEIWDRQDDVYFKVCGALERLNEQEETIEQIKKESKEFKRYIMSNIELAEKQLKTGEGNQEHIIIYKNVCEEVLEAMPVLLLWEVSWND